MGADVRGGRFELLDDGEGRVSVTSEANTALAVARALVAAPDATRNRNVLLQDFTVSQNELRAEIERQTGKALAVDVVDSYKLIEEKQAEYRTTGNKFAQYPLINAAFMTGRYGGLLEKEGEIMNETMGLKPSTLQDEVAEGQTAA